jgi:hypothetical protein
LIALLIIFDIIAIPGLVVGWAIGFAFRFDDTDRGSVHRWSGNSRQSVLKEIVNRSGLLVVLSGIFAVMLAGTAAFVTEVVFEVSVHGGADIVAGHNRARLLGSLRELALPQVKSPPERKFLDVTLIIGVGIVIIIGCAFDSPPALKEEARPGLWDRIISRSWVNKKVYIDRRQVLKQIAFGLAAGFAGLLASAFGVRFSTAFETMVASEEIGIIGLLSVGVGFGLTVKFRSLGAESDDQRMMFARGIAFGLAFGLASGLGTGLAFGLASGLGTGLGFILGIVLDDPWGYFLAFHRKLMRSGLNR